MLPSAVAKCPEQVVLCLRKRIGSARTGMGSLGRVRFRPPLERIVTGDEQTLPPLRKIGVLDDGLDVTLGGVPRVPHHGPEKLEAFPRRVGRSVEVFVLARNATCLTDRAHPELRTIPGARFAAEILVERVSSAC